MQNTKIVVYEMTKTRLWPRIVVTVMGLLAAIVMIVMGYYKPPTIETLIAMSVATIFFGVALLLTWRKKGEYEIVELKDGRVMIMTSHSPAPSFDAPVSQTRFQRLRLPNGVIQLYMRDGQKAVELAKMLPQKQRDLLADRLEEVLS